MKQAFSYTAKALSFDKSKRTVEHVISDGSFDRVGDTIDPEGWILDHKPAVLADHVRSIDAVIGKNLELRIEGKGRAGKLVAVTQFAETERGQTAFELVEAGLVETWSIGAAPQKGHSVRDGAKAGCSTCVKRKDALVAQAKADGQDQEYMFIPGVHYQRQELIEYTLTPTPCNPNAMNRAQKTLLTSQAHRDFLQLDPLARSLPPRHREADRAASILAAVRRESIRQAALLEQLRQER